MLLEKPVIVSTGARAIRQVGHFQEVLSSDELAERVRPLAT